jgi:hypothetical protein
LEFVLFFSQLLSYFDWSILFNKIQYLKPDWYLIPQADSLYFNYIAQHYCQQFKSFGPIVKVLS